MAKSNYSFEEKLFGIESTEEIISQEVLTKITEANNTIPPEEIKNSLHFTPGLKIVPCCGNCRFFWYEKVKPRRGYCTITYPNEPKTKLLDDKEYRAVTFKKWLQRHCTNLCDRHIYQSNFYSFDKVSQWVKFKFEYNGSLSIASLKMDDLVDHPVRPTAPKNAKTKLSKNRKTP